ncbi:MAG: hypothetical protein IJ571_10145 [Ruminococcus sp.]|nr:hypothetical protein [Ruminococcus sp.]
MLSPILSRAECAKCKMCCIFDSYDLWETPYITRELAAKIIQEIKPDQQFVKKEDHFLLKMEKEKDADLYYCPLLDQEKGCILGDEKPFDCLIWPFRIMHLGSKRVITLSPVCPNISERSVKAVREMAEQISDRIFEYADENPDAVKPYIEGYPIIIVEKDKFKSTLL